MWECVYAFTLMFLCADCAVEKDASGLTSNVHYDDVIVFRVPESPGVSLVSLSSKTGVDTIETVSKGFVAWGFVWTFAIHIFIFSLKVLFFLDQKVSGVDQLLCYRLCRVGAMLSHVGAFGGMSPSTLESYVNCLTFIDFFVSLTLTNIFSSSFSFSDFYLFIDTFVYCFIDLFPWIG